MNCRDAELQDLTGEPFDAVLDRVARDTAPPDERVAPLIDLESMDLVEEAGPPERESSRDTSTALDQLHIRVRVELGRRRLPLEEALGLSQGDVVDLNKSVEEPVEIYAGELLVARGEVVVIDGRLGVRVTEVVGTLSKSIVEAKS